MNTAEYRFHSKPFKHQLEVFHRTAETPYWALFWEQGTAKTKPTLDTAAFLYESGKIDCLIVVAPNGVHRNWVTDEVPAHWPRRVPLATFVYYSSRANTVASKQAAKAMLAQGVGLQFLAITYDGYMTKEGRKLVDKLLETKRCLMVLDEAHRIKTPGAKRTKALLAAGKYAKYRRVLTGTPIANGPFDAYSIMKFLHLEFWKKFYLDSYTIYKHHFGIWKPLDPANNAPWAPAICVAFRNLDQLEEIIATASDRVTKDQVLDLPPKLYSKRYFELNSEQRRIYEQLETEFMSYLDDELVTAPLAITRLLRLQQVTCGYIPTDDSEGLRMIGDSNPRMSLLAEIIEDIPHGCIIWAKFTTDIDQICALLGDRCYRYDGRVGNDERAAAKAGFQAGTRQFIVINEAINEGLTLTKARTVVYYNNSFKLTDRLQSEDRAHRAGQTHPVNYIDIVAQDTVDVGIVNALIKKLDVASQILGDEMKTWLRGA